MAIQTQRPIYFPAYTSPSEPVDKKRMRDKKGKEVSEEGEIMPIKDLG